MTLLAIPDIHGQKDELDRVLRLADAECGVEARIVFLGDLVDRGPDSRGVIERLIEGIAEGRDWIVLRGNHDQRFLDVLSEAEENGASFERRFGWLSANFGGAATLRSYGARIPADDSGWHAAARRVPQAHRRFLASLPYCHETSEHVFVHAGIRPGVPLDRQDGEDMIWIREPFLSDRRAHGKLIIHGHTPVDTPAHYGNRVNLDGGAGWGRALNLFAIDGREVFRLTGAGSLPLERR